MSDLIEERLKERLFYSQVYNVATRLLLLIVKGC